MKALRACPHTRVLRALSHHYLYIPHRYASTAESLPRVAQPSFWHSIVPRFLREQDRTSDKIQAPKSKEWNPATFYIVIFLLIGSNAIQMIALRNDFLAFSRKADAKIGLLREVLERIQKGEEVDVKGLLGTGDKDQEREWEEVLREIEKEGPVIESKADKREARRARKAEENRIGSAEPETRANPDKAIEGQGQQKSGDNRTADTTDKAPKKPNRRPLAFY
ncbi:hypothetical protein MMC30_008591 [Trapelia coarctata]|nr:hypothetical protein [Trapelia coarctata]